MELDVPDAQLFAVHRQPPVPALTDVAAAVRDALETPLGFPPLRRALTPDDHITVVVDESLADVPRLLTPLLEYLAEARITPYAITLLCQPADAHPWVDRLPAAFRPLHV